MDSSNILDRLLASPLVAANEELIAYLTRHMVQNIYELDYLLDEHCATLLNYDDRNEIVARALDMGMEHFDDRALATEDAFALAKHPKVRDALPDVDQSELLTALMADQGLRSLLGLAVNPPVFRRAPLGAHIVLRVNGTTIEAAACATLDDAERTLREWARMDLARSCPTTPFDPATAASTLAELGIRFSITNSIRSFLR